MPDSKTLKPLLPYIATGIVLVAIVWVFAYRSVVVESDRTLAQSAAQAERITGFFEEHVLKIFRYSDTYLKMARREYLERGSIPALQKLIADVPMDKAILSHITIIDETGNPLWISGYEVRPGTTAKDRPYFKFHQENGGDRIFISLPHKGRNTGKFTVRLVRRLNEPDGRFNGVIFASIDIEHITQFFTAMNLGSNSSATLVGTDKKIRARSSYGSVGPGQDISGSRIWRELAQSPVGLYKQRSVVDDVTRYYAYRLLSEFPLIVAIGVATEDISSAVTAVEIPTYLIALLITLVIATMTAALCREADRARTDIETREKSEAHSREILEKSPMGVAVMHHTLEEGQIVAHRLFANNAFAQMIGLGSPEELINTDVSDSWVDQQELQRANKILAGGGELNDFESLRIRPDGKECWISMNSRPIKFDGLDCTMVWHFDVTARKAAEARLRQSQKMEAVGQLTGGVAHDFNNLLAVIMGNTDILIRRREYKKGSLESILKAAKRGAELTQRLLAFSRQQPLRPQAIDLKALVAGMSDLLTRSLGETIEIEIRADPGLQNALADAGQVENALLNLALNARDAMADGGKLTIECSNIRLDDFYVAENPDALAGDYCVLTVSDEGTGMTEEVKAHAFEPFFTTKEVGEGSGLGLSMVYGFAKQSGGHVTLYSEEGRGTTVKLYLPQAETPPAREDTSQEQEAPQGQGETILVIEDDPDVRDLAQQMLRGLGYRVIEAADAAAAQKVLAAGEAVDLVLSDVILSGGTSGPEFAEQARAVYPDLKIIFMSGYPAEAAKRSGVLGADQVLLNKPFRMHALAKALRQALG